MVRWVYATDASEEGFGVVKTEAEYKDIELEARRAHPAEVVETLEASYDDDVLDPVPVPVSEPPLATDRRLFGDVFSGTGGFGSAVAQLCGVDSFFVDTGISARHDLRKPRNLRRLRRAIEAGIFFMLHFAPPCSTWSMARLPRLRRRGAGS